MLWNLVNLLRQLCKKRCGCSNVSAVHKHDMLYVYVKYMCMHLRIYIYTYTNIFICMHLDIKICLYICLEGLAHSGLSRLLGFRGLRFGK